jgi:hypothetical protein
LGVGFFFVLSWLWRHFWQIPLPWVSWVLLMIGRLGFYIFYKKATLSGVTLWIRATGATKVILAFPLFMYFLLPHKFTKKYFGFSWGSGFRKILIGFTGWLVFFCYSWKPVLWPLIKALFI